MTYRKQANNLKLILCAFEQLSGLKINFHKSKIFCFGEAKVTRLNIQISLDANVGLILLDIWGSLCIIKK